MELNLSSLSSGFSARDPVSKNVKILIIGSGPAGLSAALYAARAELQPVVLTGTELGGQVSLTHTVENYPGFPEGIGGLELVKLFQKQAERYGAKIEFEYVTDVDFSIKPYRVHTYDREYLSDAIIIATGATPNRLNIRGEEEYIGRGVSYCATCDGWFFKDKDVIVVGGGDSALEESVFLTRYVRSITIMHRRATLRAGTILQKRAMENPKIKFVWNTVVTEIIGADVVNEVRLKNTITGEQSCQTTGGVFIFIGHSPNTELFKGKLEMDVYGYLVTDKWMQTDIAGVFAAGEVTDPTFRQVITSAGMGAAAAIRAIHYVQEVKQV